MNDKPKQLPDTPWHIGYSKKDENDPRRHKRRCIYLSYDKCQCNRCETYLLKCPSSSHCKYYAETKDQDTLNKHNQLSAENENQDRAEKHRQSMRNKCSKMVHENRFHFHELDFNSTRFCPICGDKLKVDSSNAKHCSYCNAIYIHINELLEVTNTNLAFFMLNSTSDSNNLSLSKFFGNGTCKWLKKNCNNKSSKNYTHCCKKCELYQPIKLLKNKST